EFPTNRVDVIALVQIDLRTLEIGKKQNLFGWISGGAPNSVGAKLVTQRSLRGGNLERLKWSFALQLQGGIGEAHISPPSFSGAHSSSDILGVACQTARAVLESVKN